MTIAFKPIIVQLIDAACLEDAEDGFRPHLGGSMIGEKCERKLVYSFRWARKPTFPPNILRLFKRGHLEEFRFVSYLRRIGAEVREYSQRLLYHAESDSYIAEDWDTDDKPEIAQLDDVTNLQFHQERAAKQGIKLKQWRILDVDGHFGGSLDGIALEVPGNSDLSEQVLVEFKTHNAKSFIELVTKGVKICKPIHYAQMQIYMFKKGLKRALYMAVNKDNDELWAEWVEIDPMMGPQLIEKADRVIHAKTLPKRIANHASWMDCKYCDMKDICHHGEPMLKHCRTCRFSTPVEEGQWRCDKWNSIIPVDAIPKGCDYHEPITD